MTEKVFFSSFINTHLTFIFGKETTPVSHHDQILIFGIETIPVCHHQGKGTRAILIRTGNPMTMNGERFTNERKKLGRTKAQHEHRPRGDDVGRDGPRGRRRALRSAAPEARQRLLHGYLHLFHLWLPPWLIPGALSFLSHDESLNP